MPASLHEWINRLKHKPLPAMTHTVQTVAALMGRSSTTNVDYQHIVARDPGFALSIFRHLGNLPRPPREPITNLAHAVALAGIAPLEAGVNSLPVIEDDADDGGQRNLLASYSRAAHAALYLYQWAAFRKDPNAEELMLGALLHECGELALWYEVPDQMSAIETRVERGLNRESAFLAVFGFTHSQLSLGLAEAWALPPLVCESLSPGGAFQPRPLGIMLACELARSSGVSWDSEQTMDLIELAAEYCQQTNDQAAACLHTQSAEIARQLHGLRLPLSATELIQLQPKPEPEKVPFQKEQATASGKPEASPISGEQVKPEKSDLAHPTPSISPPPEAHRTPPKTQGLGSLQAQLTDIMKQLRDNAGLERAMFAMITPDRKSIRAKFIIGAEKSVPIKTFQANLEKRNLFSILLSKPQSFWLNSGNRKRYLAVIPLHLHGALNTQGFFVSSLFINDKAIGILYADCANTTKLDNGSFTYFKQLSEQLSKGLSNTGKTRATG